MARSSPRRAKPPIGKDAPTLIGHEVSRLERPIRSWGIDAAAGDLLGIFDWIGRAEAARGAINREGKARK
jgi:hypothetical protein